MNWLLSNKHCCVFTLCRIQYYTTHVFISYKKRIFLKLMSVLRFKN